LIPSFNDYRGIIIRNCVRIPLTAAFRRKLISSEIVILVMLCIFVGTEHYEFQLGMDT
jgi:hypothetical protein